MAHAQKPELVFLRNGRVHLNRQGGQFSRLLAVEEWRRLVATHSIRLFPLHFPSRASPCATRFRVRSTYSSSNGEGDCSQHVCELTAIVRQQRSLEQ